ncbi:MAG: hypothetical protein NC177_15525 [Ruminococcus flavefaciens]|nr:hypothetical protein [Ruminococcus flavefaciens]
MPVKREQLAFKTAVREADDPELKQVMQDSLNYSNSLVKDRQAKMRDFIRQTGQERDYFREQNYPKENLQNSLTSTETSGIINGRSSGKNDRIISNNHTFEKIGTVDFNDLKAINKSLHEFELKYKDSNIEHCRVFSPNGNVYEVHGDSYRVNTSLLGSENMGSINEHNHVTGESEYSFSWEDLESCADDGTKMAIAFDEKYRYYMVFPDKKLSEKEVYDVYQKAKHSVDNDMIFYPDQIPIGDEQHERIKRACDELGIKYLRQEISR